MQIKTMIRFLLAVMFLFFASTGGAWAESYEVPTGEVSTSCTTPAGWTVELVDGYPKRFAPCDVAFSDLTAPLEECFLWAYHVKNLDGNTSGLNHVNFTFPVNYSQPTFMEQASGTMALYDPGKGDSSTGYGFNIFELFIGHFTPQSTTQIWSYYSSEGKQGAASVMLKVGKKYEGCSIVGPNSNGVDPTEIFTYSSLEEVTTSDNKKFQFERDSVTRCITNAWKAKLVNGEWVWESMDKVPIGQVLKAYGENTSGTWEAKIEIGFGDTNQKCDDAWIKSEGENTWYKINGKWVWR